MLVIDESDLIGYFTWMLGGQDGFGALLNFLIVAAVVALIGLLAGYFVAAVRHGPIAAGDITFGVVTNGVRELFEISFRRVWALARLAMQEAWRRRVWVALAIFILMLSLASWFLDVAARQPVRLYMSFVYTTSFFLLLMVSLFLSAFSLPADIKNKTIFTVVTKPVRAGELVLGRILGFTLVMSALLLVMGGLSYLFVVRGLHHTHRVVAQDVQEVTDAEGQVIGYRGTTSSEMYHGHDFTLGPDGRGVAESTFAHTHQIELVERNGEREFVVGPPRNLFQARVPRYGKLTFLDRLGKKKERGISVGSEWSYRSYIDGGTSATAIWTFEDLHPEDFEDVGGLPLEMYIRVYRSYKGVIDQGIMGTIQLKNPHPDIDRACEIETFIAKDFYIDEHFFPRELKDTAGEPIDLFEDLVDNGRLEVHVQCAEPAMYFGVAQGDVYIRGGEGSFAANFAKGFSGMWAQMVLVISLGVMFSTFLSGPIALMATAGCVILGFFTEFMTNVITGELEGGGPVEALLRLVRQQNVMSDLEEGALSTTVETMDRPALYIMDKVLRVLPDFSQLDRSKYLAYGFDIPFDLVARNLTSCLAFVVGTFIAGYFFLRIREVAK